MEFVPRMPEDVQMCEQMTKFANYKFMQNDGYRLLNDVFQDAMVKKTGIAKVMYEDKSKSEIHEFRNLTDEEFNYLIEPDEVTVLEHTKTVEASIEDEEGLEVETVIHDVKISRQKTEGDISITSIPPEEFFVDRNARSIDDFFVIGHRTDMTIGDLLAMGFDHEEVHNLQGDMATFEAESEFERRNYAVDEDDDESADPTSRKVVVTEAYMKLDKEGTGKPLMYQFILGGSHYKVLSCELAEQVPFAVFEVDPEPHAFF